MHNMAGKWNRSPRNGLERSGIFSGLAFTLVFGILFFRTEGWFWVFPLVFVGIMPLVRGLTRLFESRRFRRPPFPSGAVREKPFQKETKAAPEKQILRLARDQNGTVTPALVALHTELSLKEAEKKLQNLTGEGHCSMEVNDNGKVEYIFSEFRPELE